MIVSIVFFILVFIATISGLVSPTVRNYKVSNNGSDSKQSLYLSESGTEDAFYRIRRNRTINNIESISLNGATVTTTITDDSAVQKTVVSIGDLNLRQRKSETILFVDDGVVFPFKMHAGDGGISLQNSSQVEASTFSNGPITGVLLNPIIGNIISAGDNGLVNNIASTMSSRARSIQNSSVGTEAYYTSISNTTVNGSPCYNPNCYPDTADTAKQPLSITASMIDAWETAAKVSTYGGACPYNISGGTVNLGPVKIPCNLNISGNAIINFRGPVWVTGNITVSSAARLRIDPMLNNQSVALIADDPLNHNTSSKITFPTGSSFVTATGSGSGSYILFVSEHDYVASGGADAIIVNSSINVDALAYARNGNISILSPTVFQAISGYKITGTDSFRFQNAYTVDPNFPAFASWKTKSWKEI